MSGVRVNIPALRPRPQVPACDRCSVGVMDATNQHLWGACDCECHRPDFLPPQDKAVT